MRKIPATILLSLLLISSASHRTAAQDFPTKPVRITSPYPLGSGPDIALHFIGDQLSKQWRQPVVVEAKPGGDGAVAVNAFMLRPADGHDLLLLGNGHLAINPILKKGVISYDVERDFAPLTLFYRAPYYLTVSANSSYKSISDLIAAAKARPGRVSYGSPYVGSPVHLGSALLERLSGTQMIHVPFRETTQLFASVARGEVDWGFGTLATVKSLIDGNLLKILAVAQERRSSERPDVPTAREAGSPENLVVDAWVGFVTHRNVSTALQQRIQSDLVAMLSEPAVKDRLLQLGFEPLRSTAAEMTQAIRTDRVKYGDVIEKAGVKLN